MTPAQRTAEIERGVREVMDASAAGRDLCVTFEVFGATEQWVQFTAGASINMAYPFDEEPSALPSRLGVPPQTLELVEWEARAFATFNIEAPLTVEEIARIIVSVFDSTIGCVGAAYDVKAEVVELEG